MNEQRAKRLDAKYGTVSVSSGKKQLDIGRRAGRDRALGATEVRKNCKKVESDCDIFF